MHPAHEAGMNVAGRIGQDEIGEIAVDIREIGRRSREFFAKLRANRIRNRLPDRPLANGRDVVDHVIEHAMTLGTDVVPVVRIERLARRNGKRYVVAGLAHAARSCRFRARRTSMAAKASKILRICGGL